MNGRKRWKLDKRVLLNYALFGVRVHLDQTARNPFYAETYRLEMERVEREVLRRIKIMDRKPVPSPEE